MKTIRTVYQLEPFKDFILSSKVKVDLGGQRSLFEKVAQFNEKHCWKGLMKISRLVFELEPFKDSVLASEVKFDLGGQRSIFEKVAQFNEKHCWKGLIKISRMVFESEPFTILFWPPHFYQFEQYWPFNLHTKFGWVFSNSFWTRCIVLPRTDGRSDGKKDPSHRRSSAP